MKTVDYSSEEVPEHYRCAKCGAVHCKLWRPYQTFQVELFCADCAEKNQRKKFEGEKLKQVSSLGWLIAAVPTEEEDVEAYWGYMSIPQAACDWWDRLPMRPTSPRDWSPREKKA